MEIFGSRREAQEAGASRYFTGAPCSRGHVAERLTRNASCVACDHRRAPASKAEQKARDKFRKKYGVEIDVKFQMIADQAGRCAICESAEELFYDHCHATGFGRAALCRHCNMALGHAKDDPFLLRAMADYIEFHRM